MVISAPRWSSISPENYYTCNSEFIMSMISADTNDKNQIRNIESFFPTVAQKFKISCDGFEWEWSFV